jgi:asparagine synthetase B (glutamine-hydrolysing)
LAILDIPGGSQPMHSEDGGFVLIFNGEIVNAPDLPCDCRPQIFQRQISSDDRETNGLFE